jgi:16S rRNA (adenine1518-N6/adenine1519-N6)-dimethyltransferase
VTLSAIRTALAALGMQPTRSLGQNFLHDQNLAEWTVGQLDIQPGEPWVEIGPGLGALTEFALARSERGMLIEKDDRIIDYLRTRFPTLDIIHGDAVAFDVRELFPRGPVKVLGNLPYYVSSQILFNFTADPSPVSALVFTLQKELAERLSAAPGSKEYGALTLLIGRRWRVRYLKTLPPGVFTPVPQVESAVVSLTPRAAGEVEDCDGLRFERLVKQGFSQRRKQLRKMLAGEVADWPQLASRLGVPETARAEELDLAQWVMLTNLSAARDRAEESLRPPLGQDVHGEIFDIVDEHDHVLGTATRHEAHAQKLRHRAVHIFVFNRQGELFLQLRSRWKDMHPRRWDSSAAGHVNAGQAYAETAERELVEELGVEAPVREIGAISACPGTGWEFVRLYRAEHEGPFALPPGEIETGGWFSAELVDRWVAARPGDFATGFLECWKVFRQSAA